MKPEPLKGKDFHKECIGCQKECDVVQCRLKTKKGYLYRDFNIKAAVEWAIEEINNPSNLKTDEAIINEAFEDVVK